MDRVFLNPILIQARRSGILPNDVFAAFFSAKGAVAAALRGGPPGAESGGEYDRPQAGGYSSRKRANGRVNDSAGHCSNRYQGNVPLQKRDQKKSSSRDTDSGPVN